jgi:HK97 family phage prohead protease
LLPQTKHITTTAELKDAGDDQGVLKAVFSVFDVVDSDGDVVLKSAFKNGQAVPMVWAHDWERPIGNGTVQVDAEKAVFDGRLWLDTDDGLQAFRKIRNAGALQEFSWGFRVTDAEPGTKNGQQVRFIKGAEVFEVSPVLVGANRNTHTLAIKQGCACTTKVDSGPADDSLEEKPYSIANRGDEFCVLNDDTGEMVACHPTRGEALRHQRALMANAPDASAADEGDGKGDEDEPEAKRGARFSRTSRERIQSAIAALTELLADAGATPDEIADAVEDVTDAGKSADSPEPASPPTLAEQADALLARLDALASFAKGAPPIDGDERLAVNKALTRMAQVRGELETLLRRTDAEAESDPRNLYARYVETARLAGLCP